MLGPTASGKSALGLSLAERFGDAPPTEPIPESAEALVDTDDDEDVETSEEGEVAVA